MTQTLDIEQFNPKKAEILALVSKHEPSLAIEIVDAKTYKQVHESQMELRETRVRVEKQWKAMREDANAFIKAVLWVERDLIAPLVEVEDKLKEKKEAYEKSEKEKKDAIERAKQQLIADRTFKLAKYRIQYDAAVHGDMTPSKFAELLETEEIKYQEAEAARLAQEEADKKAREEFEAEQKKFREEQDAIAKKNQEEQARLDAEKKKIEDDKRAIEQARIDAENEKQRQADIEKARLKAIEDERLRVEQEKLRAQQKEKEEREAMEKKKKYIAYRESLGFTEDTKHLFDERREWKIISIWKKVWEFTI